MVLGDAGVHKTMDNSDRNNERNGTMSDSYAVSTFLPLSSRLQQVAGETFQSSSIDAA
jgi:hypothetical protein